MYLAIGRSLSSSAKSELVWTGHSRISTGDVDKNPDKGGYPYWHCELHPSPGDYGESLHRVALWTIYLNDNFSEGETEFLYQRRRIVPKRGSVLIAPTAFTHTHRGYMPKGGDKYIATSWVLFRRRASASAAPGKSA